MRGTPKSHGAKQSRSAEWTLQTKMSDEVSATNSESERRTDHKNQEGKAGETFRHCRKTGRDQRAEKHDDERDYERRHPNQAVAKGLAAYRVGARSKLWAPKRK